MNRAKLVNLSATREEKEQAAREAVWALEQTLDAIGVLGKRHDLQGYGLEKHERERIFEAYENGKRIFTSEGKQ